ncbi:hypothetical protein KPL74_08995 [Bacillus sp. NP157]|nr:hypothetical protein KPL74_08995 [Bacillus sp. NP157]
MSSFSYIILAVGIAAGFIVFLYLARAIYRASTVRKARYSDGRNQLFIDEAAGELVITQGDRTGVRRMPLGTLTWRGTGTDVRIASFKLPLAYARTEFNDYDQISVRDSVDVWVGANNAGPLLRWLNHRTKHLAPDIEGHYRALNAQKKAIAAAARRHLPETPVVECDTGRTLEQYAYVAFLPSGFVYGMDSSEGIPQPVLRVFAGNVHQGKGRTIDVDYPMPNPPVTFSLSASEMSAIQKLQEKGVLRLEPARRSTY